MIRVVEKRHRSVTNRVTVISDPDNFGPVDSVVTFREKYFSVRFVEILIYFRKVVGVLEQL